MTSILSSTIRRRIGAMMTSTTRMSQQSSSPLLLPFSSLPSSISATNSTPNCSQRMLQVGSSPSSSSSLKYFSSSEAPMKQKENNENEMENGGGSSSSSGGGAGAKPSARMIPTRHSRHHIPPIAPHAILDNATNKILDSIPGTLFAYETSYLDQSKQQEYETGLSVSHYQQEQIEYLLRGYSSLIPNSIVRLQSPQSPKHPMYDRGSFTAGKIEVKEELSVGDMEKVVDKMIQLVERMEVEGKVYVELRSKLRAQMAQVLRQTSPESSSSSDSDSESDSDSDSDGESSSDGDDATREAWKMAQLIQNYGAPPGPSAAMYDLILDAIANIIDKTSNPIQYIKKAAALFESSTLRNELDQKQKMDIVNLDSIPTAATFNALIRISANVVKESGKGKGHDEEVRDEAITNAFVAFDALNHHPHVHINSATFNYLVRTVNKFYPDCKAKGCILASLWDKCALVDAVLDENIIQALLEVKTEDCGEEVHRYFKKFVFDRYDDQVKNGYGFALKYSRNKKKKRFDKMLDVY